VRWKPGTSKLTTFLGRKSAWDERTKYKGLRGTLRKLALSEWRNQVRIVIDKEDTERSPQKTEGTVKANGVQIMAREASYETCPTQEGD